MTSSNSTTTIFQKEHRGSDKKMLSLEGWTCLEQHVFFLVQKFQECHCDSLWTPISTCDERPPEAVRAGRCRAEQLQIWRLKRWRKLGVRWTRWECREQAREIHPRGGSVELRWMIWSPVHQRTVCLQLECDRAQCSVSAAITTNDHQADCCDCSRQRPK